MNQQHGLALTATLHQNGVFQIKQRKACPQEGLTAAKWRLQERGQFVCCSDLSHPGAKSLCEPGSASTKWQSCSSKKEDRRTLATLEEKAEEELWGVALLWWENGVEEEAVSPCPT